VFPLLSSVACVYRKVMGWDEDAENVTETVDITGFNF
jgi:hypothetical protein